MSIKNLFQVGAVFTVMLMGQSTFASPMTFFPDIVGGTSLTPSSPGVSSTVMLYTEVQENGQVATAICSASIITQDILVTAAHCVAEDINSPINASETRVIFGQTLPEGVVFGQTLPSQINDPSALPISGYQYNPGWVGTNNGAVAGVDAHDIALIQLQEPLPAGYAPAQLLSQNDPLTPGEQTLLEGYGITSSRDTSGRTAGTLRGVVVQIKEAVGQTEEGVDMSHRKGMCSGDSGGPAFVEQNGQLALWGVTSRSDAGCKQEGIYTRINAYVDWINQTLQANTWKTN